MKQYLEERLNISFKDNWQIFKVDDRGIDFVGYKIFHTHTLLRKRIKKNFCKKLSRLNKKQNLDRHVYQQKICSYIGWIKYCNGRNLFNKMTKHKELLQYISKNKKRKT